MASYVTMHLHNAVPGKEAALAEWYAGPHATALQRLRGFVRTDRHQVTKDQVLPGIAQPWHYMTTYDFEFQNPEIHIPALGSLLADARDAGLIAQDGSECIWSYGMYSGWRYSSNYNGRNDFTHMMMLPANFIPGREAEYHKWYDEVHCWEVSETPDFVGMRRGRLLDVQIEPKSFCPGSQLILAALQTTNLAATHQEFIGRSNGTIPDGVKHGPRSTSASMGRTVHFWETLKTVRYAG